MEQAGPQLLRYWIDRAATRDPGKTFIIAADDGRTLTYGGLRELTGRIATYLRDKGVGANDRVALLSNNSIEHWRSISACWPMARPSAPSMSR